MSRVPWLERTGFPAHLAGLRDKEISSFYQLPRQDREDEADLRRISDAADGMLGDAYELCNDKSPTPYYLQDLWRKFRNPIQKPAVHCADGPIFRRIFPLVGLFSSTTTINTHAASNARGAHFAETNCGCVRGLLFKPFCSLVGCQGREH